MKTEVQQREKIISELQNSVEILNVAHLQSTKDKIALCIELSEVCTVKEQLHCSLGVEMEKNASLDKYKKVYEGEVSARVNIK